MARVNTYLNFQGQTEEAFTLYAKVFGTQVKSMTRFRDMGMTDAMPADELDGIMHAELPILEGHVLMATDMVKSMGQECRIGNNTTISLEVDSREEADRIFDALSEGGSEGQAMGDMPWGQYWGTTLDRFGIRWMVATPPMP